MEDPIGRWLIEILLLFFCGLLALCQSALTNANESKLRASAAEGDGRAKRLLPILDRPEPVIALRGLRTFFCFCFPPWGWSFAREWGCPSRGPRWCLA